MNLKKVGLPLLLGILCSVLFSCCSVSGVPLSWTQVNMDGFGDVENVAAENWMEFGEYIYIGVDNKVTGVEIWRSGDGTFWTQVGGDGLGDSGNILFWSFGEFQSELFASISTEGQPSVARVFRSGNGTAWSQVGSDGFGDGDNTAVYIHAFKSHLVAFTYNWVTGSEIWTWNGSSWTQRMRDGIDENTRNILSFPNGEFEDHLYMCSLNTVNGTGFWRSNDGGNWIRINDYGFGNMNNTYVSGMVEFDGYLYVATYNGETGTEIWRSGDGTSWSKVGDNGFGDMSNYMGRPVVFEDMLYVSTYNWNYTGSAPASGVEVWRTGDGVSWSQVNSDGFGDINNRRGHPVTVGENLYIVTSNNVTGVEVWRTGDGVSWSQVNSDGFGDSNNKYAWVRFIFKDYLYVATTNDVTGTEVWRLDEAVTLSPDFSISASPSSMTVQAGSSSSSTITATSMNAFNSPVSLSYSWMGSEPEATTVSLPGSVTPQADSTANVTLTITTGQTAPDGTFTLRVTGMNGGITCFVDVQITITPWSGGCLVATAAYGSELSPEIQFLRQFRDEKVLTTFAGSNFMKSFNVWYYSFSPPVAHLIAGNELSKTLTRIVIYPLLITLKLSERVHSTIYNLNPEVSVLAAGLFTCTSIGLIYLTPTTTLLLAGIKGKRRLKLRLTIKPLGLTWIAGLGLLTVSEVYSLSLICSVGAVTLVLSTIMLTGVGSALKLMNKVK